MKHFIVGLAFLVVVSPTNAQFAEPNDRGVSFGHMHVVVEDLELHQRLWPELLGAKLVEKQGYSAVRVGNALIFFRNSEPAAPSVDTVVDHFGLTVRDLDSVLSRWRALGYSVDSQKIDADGHTTANITMPGGIALTLVEDDSQLSDTSMHYVQIVSPMTDRLAFWYAEFFNAKEVSANNETRVATIPGAELRFADANKERLPTDGTAIDHIGFEVREWEPFVQTLQDADIRFEFGPVYIESLDLWVAFFNDPSGVLVEVTHGLDKF